MTSWQFSSLASDRSFLKYPDGLRLCLEHAEPRAILVFVWRGLSASILVSLFEPLLSSCCAELIRFY